MNHQIATANDWLPLAKLGAECYVIEFGGPGFSAEVMREAADHIRHHYAEYVAELAAERQP